MLSKSHFCVATALPFEGLITDCLPLEAGLLQSFVSYFKLLFLHSNKM